MKFDLTKLLHGASAVALAVSLAPAAHAQDAQGGAAAAASTDDEEIVVTGTSIRGVAPIGNQVVTMDQEAIKASGATSTAQVLAHIPQLSDFGTTPAVNGGNNFQLAINRPNLRNLGSGVASTSATLILMDGHRLPGSGVLQTFPDPDIIPPALIQRVEVVPDGGSSIYGSDAVAGVVNFITRNNFDGVQVDVRHGFGDSFDTDDDALTVGKSWDGGSAFAAYSYSHRDPIAGDDRDYVRNINWITGEGNSISCDTPNVTIQGVRSGVVNGAAGGPVQHCDADRERDVFGEDERTSVMVGFSQTLGVNVDFDVKAWWTQRDIDSNNGPQRAEVTVTRNNPFSINPARNQTVDFSFRPARATEGTTNHLETWGFAPELKWDLGHDWQNRTMATYGFSRINTELPVFLLNDTNNGGADLQRAVTLGQINPYNIADPAHIDAVNALLDRREWRGFGQDEITQVRSVFDGPLFSLPGGQVHVALGAEAYTENFQTFSDKNDTFLTQAGRNECGALLAGGGTPFFGCTPSVVTDAPFVPIKASRDVKAVFAELSIPIIGESNELPFIHSFDLSLSVRHDDYSDVGGVTTKRYGFNYEPVDWIKVNGHWGDSFQAPGLADIARSGNQFTASTSIPPFAVLLAPEDQALDFNAYTFFAVQGSNPDLVPQNAEAWDLSIDITPPILDNNLTFGATFWNIDYALRIGSPLSFIGTSAVFANYPDKLQHSAVGLSYADALARFPDAASQLAGLQATGKPLYAIYDFRNNNTGGDRREGLDVRANYTDDTPWGTWFTNFNGTHFIHYTISPDVGAPFGPDQVGTDAGVPDWRYTTTLGTTVGEHWLGQLTWTHSDATRMQTPLGQGTPSDTRDDQSHIDDINYFDAFVQYEFRGTGLTQDLTLSLVVNNLTDADPPHLKGSNGQTSGFASFGNFGRIFQIGLSKHF